MGGVSGQVHADWQRVGDVPWNHIRARLAELAYVPSPNIIEDNARRLAAGLPMIRRGRW